MNNILSFFKTVWFALVVLKELAETRREKEERRRGRPLNDVIETRQRKTLPSIDGIYVHPDDVLSIVVPKSGLRKTPKVIIDGDIVSLSRRLYIFKRKGVTCAHCGRVGNFFKKMYDDGNETFFLSFVSHAEDGTDVEMTIDHILPRSKGGRDALVNLQVLCYPCNQAKADD